MNDKTQTVNSCDRLRLRFVIIDKKTKVLKQFPQQGELIQTFLIRSWDQQYVI